VRGLTVGLCVIVGMLFILLIQAGAQLWFGREAVYLFLKGTREANPIFSWTIFPLGCVAIPFGIYMAIRFDNEILPKRYYMEYSQAVGWGVMTDVAVFESCSLRGAFNHIREWSMYTSRHRHCSFEQFKWYVWMGRCSVDCLFPVPKRLKDMTDQEVKEYYQDKKLGKGFREKIKGKREE